ncbi:MAG: penicillin acylase family protein [Candidatus Acidiferrales bacterium]
MKRFLRILRYILGSVVLLASLGLLFAWWTVRRALPQVEGSAAVPGLQGEVTVERDQWGVPTITAGSMEDLLVAQGYVTAQDRMWHMDLIRHVAGGELAEIFGEAALESDRESRTYGFRHAAQASLAVMDAETKSFLEAYARGVNRYIEDYRDRLPMEFLVLRYEPRPWTAVDALLVHAYMYDVLSTTWRWELSRARVEAEVGPQRAKELFVVDSPLDHFVVGAEDKGKASAHGNEEPVPPPPPRVPGIEPEPYSFLAQWRQDVEAVLGSNNWVVSGNRTYSGKPILANDTHLPLRVPDTWYIAHLKAPGYHAKGFTLPGTPLIVIGHNERIAWGFTNNGADVQDLYAETFHPQNPGEYRVGSAWRKAEIRREIIKVKGRPDVPHEVTVTRHGPVVLREGNIGYALRWTALEPGGLGAGYSMVGRAQNWAEFLAVMRTVSGPAQNAVYADVDGNIGFVMAARVPVRRKGTGAVPVPGETDDYEWTGYIPFDELPKTLNPPEGIIGTANARVVGPGYKHYLTDRWYSPYRTEQIYRLLESRESLRPEDCIAIQADTESLPHQFLAARLQQALKRHPAKDERVKFLVEQLPEWDGNAAASSRVFALLEYTRRQLPAMILAPVLGDDDLYEWSRGQVFFENLLRHRPPQWLPKHYADYDALLVAAAEQAAQRLEEDARARGIANPEKPEEWRWGQYIRLRITHPLAQSGFLSRHLSITNVGQSGTAYSIKQTGRSIGPAMRFVADLSNWDASLMNVTMGQSGHYLSPHYRDQFDSWYDGRGLPSAFSQRATARAVKHRMTLTPQ